MPMRSFSLRLSAELLRETDLLASGLHTTRADYVRLAIRTMNRTVAARLRTKRLTGVSRRVREESMFVNREFAAFERDPCS